MCKCYTVSLGARLTRVYDVIASFLCLKLAWIQFVGVTTSRCVVSVGDASRQHVLLHL